MGVWLLRRWELRATEDKTVIIFHIHIHIHIHKPGIDTKLGSSAVVEATSADIWLGCGMVGLVLRSDVLAWVAWLCCLWRMRVDAPHAEGRTSDLVITNQCRQNHQCEPL